MLQVTPPPQWEIKQTIIFPPQGSGNDSFFGKTDQRHFPTNWLYRVYDVRCCCCCCFPFLFFFMFSHLISALCFRIITFHQDTKPPPTLWTASIAFCCALSMKLNHGARQTVCYQGYLELTGVPFLFLPFFLKKTM